MDSQRELQTDANEVRDLTTVSRTWLIAMGVCLAVLGAASLFMALTTTLLSVVLIGGLLILAAVFQSVFAMTSGGWSGFSLHLLLAFLYALAGVMLVMNPLSGAMSLTVLVGLFFLASGLFRIIAASLVRFVGRGWALISGVVTTCLGAYTIFMLPEISGILIGTLVAVDLLFMGGYLIAFGFALKPVTRSLKNRRNSRRRHAHA